MGLSVSYDRILQFDNKLATSVCALTKEIGLVCPVHLCHGLFITGALDNLDHNPSSTTAKGSFVGVQCQARVSQSRPDSGNCR